MKKKIILGLLAIVATLFTLDTVKAETEGGTANCLAPFSNTCYNIFKDGKLIATKKGVLNA